MTEETIAMTAVPSIDPARLLHEQLDPAAPDLLRQLLGTFIDALMGAEADALCGAPYGQSSEDRVNSRNGYRHRPFDTRAGTLDVAIPKLRAGTYFPDWLLERRRRAERALTTVVAPCYLLGVSTRRMEKLVESLGITRLSKSQVSVMAAELDEQVQAFRTRPLDAGSYTFVAADALVLKVREDGRVANVHALLATGVNGDGHREILGLQVSSAEDGAGWLSFFAGPHRRPGPVRGPAGDVGLPPGSGRHGRRDRPVHLRSPRRRGSTRPSPPDWLKPSDSAGGRAGRPTSPSGAPSLHRLNQMAPAPATSSPAFDRQVPIDDLLRCRTSSAAPRRSPPSPTASRVRLHLPVADVDR